MHIMEILGGDLFKTEEYAWDQSVVFAHCIASDFGMYGGIALQFIKHFDMKTKLTEKCPLSTEELFKHSMVHGNARNCARGYLVRTAVKIDNVYNLITKLYTDQKPTLEDLKWSLIDCRDQMMEAGERYLAIPDMIGCGIDGLDRDEVMDTIITIFSSTDITIYVVNRLM